MPHVIPLLPRAVLLAALVAAVATCGNPASSRAPVASPAGSAPAASSTPTTTSTPASRPGPTAGPVTNGTAAPGGSQPAGAGDRPDLAGAHVALESIATGINEAVFATTAGDGSGRLFVAGQDGRIRVVRDGSLLPTPFIDLSDRVQDGGERGLLGLAFPPGFGDGWPFFYVHYSDANGDTTVSAFRLSAGNPDVADPSSEQIVLHEQQPYPNHNGGWIGFDADGMLLIGLGDGGSGGDPENRASSLGTILGKMLRIDVLGANVAGGEAYAIPSDNPFLGRTDARPEILHSGLRNPFRDSIDPATGDLWIGDVGQNAWEEVDVAPAGARGLDFGWRRWEGRHCYNPPEGCDPAGVTMPVVEYPHPDGCSVIGGVVYRGTAIPALRGAYLYSDYCSGTLWAIDAGMESAQAPIVLAETGRAISSIGTDEAGEVVLTDLGGGELLRLVAAP